MALSAANRKALEKIEASMARQGFNLADIIDAALLTSEGIAETAAKPQLLSSAASAGGGATEAMTVTGLLTTDVIISVTQRVKGGNSLPLLGWNTQVADGITAVYSADPGAAAILDVAFIRV